LVFLVVKLPDGLDEIQQEGKEPRKKKGFRKKSAGA